MRRFYFNERFNDDLGLVVSAPINYPYTNEDIEEVQVDGMSGTYTIKKGTYPNKVVNVQISIVSFKDFWSKLDLISEWLTEINDNKLICEQRNKAYRVKYVNVGDVVRDLIAGGSSTITFTCEPFLEEIEEYEIDITNVREYYYEGTKEGEILLEIWATGNIQIIINGEVVQIENVQGYVRLDSKYMNCLNEDKTNKQFIGQFPLLIKGENTISYSGNISKIIMFPRTVYKN